ncbi:acyltransferase [Pantoea eucrina]|uniref:Acyltransferase n=1 Tax=Pantoea eucrina TaxID=472693 RepID=A0ABU5LEI6_9GAMM|nr:acyltransferase [Pantoea eucrina]MDZ7278126.1 acyltransferase [Pantoea eucrina]
MNDFTDKGFRRFPAADGIRGLAVLIVLIAHALVMFMPGTRPYLAGTGKIGVWLFFVLSAFLLTNKFLRTGINKLSLSEYFFGRLLRILPLFGIASSFYYFAGYYDFKTLTDILTFREGFAHLWTIPVEFKFYFLLPILIMIYNRINRQFGIYATLLITSLIVVTARYFYPESGLHDNSIHTRWYVSSFILGISTSYILHKYNASPRKLGIPIVLCSAAILLIIPAFSKCLTGEVLLPNLPTSYLSLSLTWSAFIFLAVNDSGLTSKILTSRVMRKIGNYSFSIYLFHWFVLTELSSRFSGEVLFMLLSILLSLFLGAIIFFLIEKNIENLRHRIQKKIINPSS